MNDTYQKLHHMMIISLALVLAGCSSLKTSTLQTTSAPSSPTPTATRRPIPTPTQTPLVIRGTISIWHAWGENELPALVQIIHDFSQNYPEVYFDVLSMPLSDLRRRFEIEVPEGNGPILLLGPAEWGPELYDAGVIANMSKMANQSILDTLNLPALRAGEFHGMLISLPYSISGVVLYRNTDILTLQADTFDELITFAESATQGEVVGAMLERSFLYSGANLISIGGELMDGSGNPLFNNTTGVSWVELLRSYEMAGPTSFLSDEDLEAFKAGKVGWIIDGTWNLAAIAETLGADKLAVDPWPAYGQGHLSGFVMAENIYVSARAPEDQLLATQKFIDYLLSPEAQARLAEVGRIPAAFGVPTPNIVNGPSINQIMTALAGGTAYPILPVMGIYTTQMDIALRSVFDGGVPPLQALQSADFAIMAELSALPTPIAPPTSTLTAPLSLTPTP